MRGAYDAKRIARLDSGGMIGFLDTWVDDFLQAYRRAAGARVAAPASLSNVVFIGMGGSGIGGNLVSAVIRKESPVPISNLRDYTVPGWIGPRSLAVAISYSGNTEETITAALEAHARGATVMAISSGGELQRLAKQHKWTHLAVPAGIQPRVAIPHLFGALLGAANALRLTTIAPDAKLERELRAFHRTLGPSRAEATNVAKQIAHGIHDRFPVFYGANALAAVALRARCQVNENAKMLARNDEVPESNHNELVAWSLVEDAPRYVMVLLRQQEEPPEIANRYAFLLRVLHRRRVPHLEFTADASSHLGRVLQTLILVDYASVYAAFLRGIDPTPVDVIVDLKEFLAKSRAKPAASGRRPRARPRRP